MRAATLALVLLALLAPPGAAQQPYVAQGAQAAPPPIAAPVVAPELFPLLTVVENGGRLTARGARVGLLSVRAPEGASVLLRCRGRDCPSPSETKPAAPVTTFRRFYRRFDAGTVLELFITRPTSVGKYTRFEILRGQEPAREDGCLAPGAASPQRCPSPIPPPAQVASLAAAQGLNAQGYVLIRQRRYAEAVPLFVTAASQATVNDQTYASSLFGLARSLRRLGRARDALTVIKRRLDFPPRTPDAEKELQLSRLAARRAASGPPPSR